MKARSHAHNQDSRGKDWRATFAQRRWAWVEPISRTPKHAPFASVAAASLDPTPEVSGPTNTSNRKVNISDVEVRT